MKERQMTTTVFVDIMSGVSAAVGAESEGWIC